MKPDSYIDRSNITWVVLVGTVGLNVSLLILILFSIFILNNHHIYYRGLILGVALVYSTLCLWLHWKQYTYQASLGIVFYYLFGATLLAVMWGVNLPFAILLYCFSILLSGVILGSRYVMPVATLVAIALFIVQFLISTNVLVIDTAHFRENSSYSDVATYAIIFGIIALLGWASGHKLEALITDLSKARRKLRAQNLMIRNELEEEKKRLRESQIEELVTLQQFADLGQNTTVILHELANQLATISLDIEDGSDSERLGNIKETIKEVEHLIAEANAKLKTHEPESFDVENRLQIHLEKFKYQTAKAKVKLHFHSAGKIPHPLLVYGDPYRLEQVVTILINNSLEAYAKLNRIMKRGIDVTLVSSDTSVIIQVRDFGTGIPESVSRDIFTSNRTTKANGHGIGLYVSRHIIRDHFHGSIKLLSSTKGTCFEITLPLKKY